MKVVFEKPKLRCGDQAPPLSLLDTEGRVVSLRPGQVTVVVFTCNHCPYALAWHDRIQAVAHDYRAQGVQVLQINANDAGAHPEDSLERMTERVRAGDFAGPYLWDPEQRAAMRWGVLATPEVFVIDADGVVRYHGAPDEDHADPDARARWVRGALDDVLAGEHHEPPRGSEPVGCSLKWRVELAYWPGCPSLETAEVLVREVLEDLGRDEVAVRARSVDSLEDARERGFVGSPTVLVGGFDLIPPPQDAKPALVCRLYHDANGRPTPLPPREQLQDALAAALVRPWEVAPASGRGGQR